MRQDQEIIDSCYARVARIGSRYQVYLEGRILGDLRFQFWIRYLEVLGL
jgi:hypothetical protein